MRTTATGERRERRMRRAQEVEQKVSDCGVYRALGVVDPTDWPSARPTFTADTDPERWATVIESEQDVYLGQLGIAATDAEQLAVAEGAARRVRGRCRRGQQVPAIDVARETRASVRRVHRVATPAEVLLTVMVTAFAVFVAAMVRNDLAFSDVMWAGWSQSLSDPEEYTALRTAVQNTVSFLDGAWALGTVIGVAVIAVGASVLSRRLGPDRRLVVVGQVLRLVCTVCGFVGVAAWLYALLLLSALMAIAHVGESLIGI